MPNNINAMPNNNRGMPNNTITIILAGMAPHSQDFNQKIAITKWTKTYEAMITAANCLRDNCNGK